MIKVIIEHDNYEQGINLIILNDNKEFIFSINEIGQIITWEYYMDKKLIYSRNEGYYYCWDIDTEYNISKYYEYELTFNDKLRKEIKTHIERFFRIKEVINSEDEKLIKMLNDLKETYNDIFNKEGE